MDFEDEAPVSVDPEVRAYVFSLVSALGGTGADEDGRYRLGDDALACLKDLKKWLRLHDEKFNRLDVARCLAEANLVEGDLLEILGAWPEEVTNDKVKLKVALACLELLVPLTWPVEKNQMEMTINHHRHIPYIQLAQTSYKRAILEHRSNSILRTAVRIALPSIAVPMRERTSRDEGIIRLLFYFFRNVTEISSPTNLPAEGKEGPIARSTTIEAFHHQDVLALILTICSNMGEDFNVQDVVILEVLFHLLKGIDVERLFMDKSKPNKNSFSELGALLAKENNMRREYAKYAPSRHNRFGTMIWVKRDRPGQVSTVSGQDTLTDSTRTLTKMDQSKKWNKPRPRGKNSEDTHERFDLPVPLTNSAYAHLRAFVEEFLDSSFNPLFSHIRKAIEREADRVLEAHKQQFFYLISWFLEAERTRRRKNHEAEKKNKDKKIAETFEPDSFALVASVLNSETFITLNRFMQDRLDAKLWRELSAGTRCFSQSLLIIQEMAESPLDEDQEIAENIQSNIFYEETTHDRIIAILRGYKDQGFGYLDHCTELSHIFLRMLEKYSKENVDLQVRSKRRARKKEKAEAKRRGDAGADGDDAASEIEDLAEAERISKERKFDFNRFAPKFMTQPCVNTFVAFTKFYNDLNPEQLKRAHRFFYRVAFKQELSVMLYRVDILALFNRMIKGPEGLDRASPIFGEWEELVKQLVKNMTRKLRERPELAVEMLFSKIPSSVFYLENGYQKQTKSSKPRAPAALEVRGSMPRDEQIGVAVAVLHESMLEAINWVARVLGLAASERQSWEAAARQVQGGASEEEARQPESELKAPAIIVHPDTEERRIAIFRNAKLRLLMDLCGFERPDADDGPDSIWIIPSSLTSKQLHETHDLVQKHRNDPIMEYGDEDPMTAEEMIRRKPAERPRRAEYDDESDTNASSGDDEFLFPGGGPTNNSRPRTAAAALEALKKKRRKRRLSFNSNVEGLDDEARERRQKAREAADREKRKKIKSEEFIHDSDTDSEADRLFFEREERGRKGHAAKIMEVLRAGRKDKRRNDTNEERKGKRRRLESEAEDTDRAVISSFDHDSSSPRIQVLSDESESELEDTPQSSPIMELSHEEVLRDVTNTQLPADEDMSKKPARSSVISDEDEDEDRPVMAISRRRNRGALLPESDSE